jgi:hypothetical protein
MYLTRPTIETDIGEGLHRSILLGNVLKVKNDLAFRFGRCRRWFHRNFPVILGLATEPTPFVPQTMAARQCETAEIFEKTHFLPGSVRQDGL